MSFSYKPVLLKAIFANVNDEGKVKVADIVDYFIAFYEGRKKQGLTAEKTASIYQKDNYFRKKMLRETFYPILLNVLRTCGF